MEQGLVVAGSAAAGGGISGFIIKMFIKNYFEQLKAERESLRGQVQELAKIIENLKKEHIDKLEIKIESHINEDKTDRLLTLVEGIANRQQHIDNKVSKQSDDHAKLCVDLAKFAANCDAAYRYIENLDRSFQTHKTQDIRIIHGGK